MGRLDELDVLGFDYDYTLASYTDKVPHFIYERALEHLIKVHGLVQTFYLFLTELILVLQLSPRATKQVF